MISSVNAPRTLTMERNPQFQTVKDAGADEVADARVNKITLTENKNNSAQVTDIQQNKVDFMVDPPAPTGWARSRRSPAIASGSRSRSTRTTTP